MDLNYTEGKGPALYNQQTAYEHLAAQNPSPFHQVGTSGSVLSVHILSIHIVTAKTIHLDVVSAASKGT